MKATHELQGSTSQKRRMQHYFTLKQKKINENKDINVKKKRKQKLNERKKRKLHKAKKPKD